MELAFITVGHCSRGGNQMFITLDWVSEPLPPAKKPHQIWKLPLPQVSDFGMWKLTGVASVRICCGFVCGLPDVKRKSVTQPYKFPLYILSYHFHSQVSRVSGNSVPVPAHLSHSEKQCGLGIRVIVWN